jgi:hypothetical protein
MDLTLTLLAGELAVVRLPPDAAVPEWAWTGSFASVTRTREELSVVCAAGAVAPDAGLSVEGPWRALAVAGPLDFSLTGIAAALTAPLAEAGVSVFVISTYDTDHLLVKASTLEAAAAALQAAGFAIARPR